MYQWLNTSLTANVVILQTIARPMRDEFPADLTARAWVLCKATYPIISLLVHCPRIPADLRVTAA